MGFAKPVINDGIMQQPVKSKQFADHVIVVPPRAEFAMGDKVFKWEVSENGSIRIIELPVLKSIEVTLTFVKPPEHAPFINDPPPTL